VNDAFAVSLTLIGDAVTEMVGGGACKSLAVGKQRARKGPHGPRRFTNRAWRQLNISGRVPQPLTSGKGLSTSSAMPGDARSRQARRDEVE
jgi:hypothetical protein